MVHSVNIGTSGWSFKTWKGVFYPEDIDVDNMISTYALTFSTVELNHSFYQLPKKKEINIWCDKTPEHFIFSCKVSRYITHMKKLKDPKKHVSKFINAITPFGKKLGPILFQLPPYWSLNYSRLKDFIDVLPDEYRYCFEFRHNSWFCEMVYDLLRESKIALCFYDLKGFQSPEEVTTDFIYTRLHGPKEKAYEGSYDGRTLAGYAQKFVRWQQEGKKIFCYFDNDKKACAPKDALFLIQSFEKQS